MKTITTKKVLCCKVPTNKGEQIRRILLDNSILNKNYKLKKEDNLKSGDDFKEVAAKYLEKNGLKLKHLAQPIRVAVVGSAVSPSVFDVLSIVRLENVIQRINNLIRKRK